MGVKEKGEEGGKNKKWSQEEEEGVPRGEQMRGWMTGRVAP